MRESSKDLFTPADRLRLSRLISQLENLDANSEPPIWKEGAEIGKAYRIGITGPLGVGKSTLVNGMARQMRAGGWRVGILAVDPSSPISGGALLGDRVRMTDLAEDDGVFIRSFATRGEWGGLASVTSDAADLLDQAGFERILIETVGVGQIEVDIAGACDLTVVVLEPSSGDAIQTLKAGLMEVADIFVVNKADLRGADRFIGELEQMVQMKRALKGEVSGWQALQSEAQEHHPSSQNLSLSAPLLTQFPPIIPTIARTGVGIPQLVETVEEWFLQAIKTNLLKERRKKQYLDRIKRLVEGLVLKRLWSQQDLSRYVDGLKEGLTPRQAARLIGEKILSEIHGA